MQPTNKKFEILSLFAFLMIENVQKYLIQVLEYFDAKNTPEPYVNVDFNHHYGSIKNL